jgi:tetratricopeptide (TPR) repeat protein
MFGAAREEWRWIYGKKLEEIDKEKAADRVKLGDWARKSGLYDEALKEYEAALAIDPENSRAKKGLQELTKLLEVPVNSQMLRVVKGPMDKAVNFMKKGQNKDGSFGADIRVAGVQGHQGCSALAGLALISQWEFDSLENFRASTEPPKELEQVLKFVLENVANNGKLRGPDAWGPAWRLVFLAKAYSKSGLKKYKGQIEKRTKLTIDELKKIVRSDGGWAYYNFVKITTTFITAVVALGMEDCRDQKLPFDKGMFDKCISSLMNAKKGASMWTYKVRMGGEAAVGCAGRSSLLEMVMTRAGKDQGGLQGAMDNFFKHRHLLEAIKGRRGTHIGTGKTAPYYYLFGHYWTTRAIKMLPRNAWGKYLNKMRDIIMKDQESDGSFFDWPMAKAHKSFGSALGALTLYELAIEPRENVDR